VTPVPYSCASVCWTKRQWSTKPHCSHWFRWVFLSSTWWITDDIL